MNFRDEVSRYRQNLPDGHRWAVCGLERAADSQMQAVCGRLPHQDDVLVLQEERQPFNPGNHWLTNGRAPRDAFRK